MVLSMTKAGWRSVTLSEDLIREIRRLGMVPETSSVQDAITSMVLVIERWRKKYLWDHWHQNEFEVEIGRIRIEKNQDQF